MRRINFGFVVASRSTPWIGENEHPGVRETTSTISMLAPCRLAPRTFAMHKAPRSLPVAVKELCAQRQFMSTHKKDDNDLGQVSFRQFIKPIPDSLGSPEFEFVRNAMAYNISRAYSNFLMSDVSYRLIQGKERNLNFPLLMPWGLIRPRTVDALVGV